MRQSFRAWDRRMNYMFPVHEIHFHKMNYSLDHVVGYNEPDSDGWTVHGTGNPMFGGKYRFILMQGTGIKDKKNTEIFEGDIFECLGHLYEVYWSEHWAMFTVRGPKIEALMRFAGDAKIVGNIYANPELLAQM